MCGLTGFFRPGDREPVAPSEAQILEAMNATLEPRGPDESGTWTGPGVGLAARRLSILDIADSHQPQFGPSGKTVCVYNGEIYNYRAIRDELIAAGHTLRTEGDTELIPHGYEAWGLDGLLRRLNGMFAFALFDQKSRQLFLARDRVGIKPLYAGQFGGTWLFGSELKALLQHPACERVVIGCGFSGHGFKFSPVLGEGLADLVLDGATALPIDFLSLKRFESDP